MRLPKLSKPIDGPCTRCKREPRPGETYGPHEEGWDFTGICPTCWNEITAEPEEEEAALERDAVEEAFGPDGVLYEDATGKTLGDP